MKPDKQTFQDLFDRSRAIQEQIAASEQSRPKQLEAGDLFFLRMPRPVHVTWCAVFPHSKDNDLWYCVPGDSFSLVSAADVSAPASAVREELNFRCQCGLWVHAEDVDLANRVDRLAAAEVNAIRAVVSELASSPVAVFAADDVAGDPDYGEWIETLHVAVDALVESLHDEPAQVVRLIGLESEVSQVPQALSLAADDSATEIPDAATQPMRQRLQVFASSEGSLQACLYDDGVVFEWHTAQDGDKPMLVHNADELEWFFQQTFWCSRVIAWIGDRLEVSANGEPVAFVKPRD